MKINGFSKKACYFSKVLEGSKNIFEQEASISDKKKSIYFLKVGLTIVFFKTCLPQSGRRFQVLMMNKEIQDKCTHS